MTPAELDRAITATWDARRDIGDLAGMQLIDGVVTAFDVRTQTIRIGLYADKLTQSVIDSVAGMVASANPDDYGNAPLGGVILMPPQDVSIDLDFGDTVRAFMVIVLDDGTLRDIVGATYP